MRSFFQIFFFFFSFTAFSQNYIQLGSDLKDNVDVERIEFIDYSGKSIAPKHSKRKDNTLTLDVSNLYSGIYILNLVTEKGRSKARVIIE